MAGTWCRCNLLRTPPDSSPWVSSSLYPDMSSIASDAWSQYSPLPKGSCFDAPDKKNHIPPKQQDHLVSSLGPLLETGTKEPFRRYTSRYVLRIRAFRVRVHSQISYLTPHSARRCSTVSCPSHWVHLCVFISQILCNLTFVGTMSWTTMYHADLAPSENLRLWRLPRQNAAIPRREGNFVMFVNFIFSLVSMAVPLLFIPSLV